MATKQWVNLPESSTATIDRSKMTGDGVDSVDVMGQSVYIKATLDKKNAGAMATLNVKPDGDNAVYAAGDKGYAKAIASAQAAVANDGEVKWKVRLSSAGGDKFKFEVECNGDTKELPDEFETHRRLYYQAIGMDGITGLANLGFWEAEFKKKKRNIHLHSVNSKGKIDRVYNFDFVQADFNKLFNLAKVKYKTDKDPYCFAVVWADCLAQGPKRKELEKAGVSKGGTVTIPLTTGQLWKDIDKSASAADWLLLAAFEYTKKDGTPGIFPIPDADVSSDYKKVKIKTRNFPAGVNGKIKVAVNIAEGFHGGWSFPTLNIIVCATRGPKDKKLPKAELKAILVHESGHKVGQVPNGSGALAKQSTHDDVYDPRKKKHCNDRGCTMWYSTKYKKAVFCDECDKSVRKQYLHYSIPGLKRFY